MKIDAILATIEAEIHALEQARDALKALTGTGKRGRGRPRKSASAPVKKTRVLTAEARAKMAAAQKRRWAEVKKAKG